MRQWGPSLFPPYFERLLHPFFCALLLLDADARVAAVQRDFHTLLEGIHGPGAGANGVLPLPKLHVTESPSAEKVCKLLLDPETCKLRSFIHESKPYASSMHPFADINAISTPCWTGCSNLSDIWSEVAPCTSRLALEAGCTEANDIMFRASPQASQAQTTCQTACQSPRPASPARLVGRKSAKCWQTPLIFFAHWATRVRREKRLAGWRSHQMAGMAKTAGGRALGVLAEPGRGLRWWRRHLSSRCGYIILRAEQLSKQRPQSCACIWQSLQQVESYSLDKKNLHHITLPSPETGFLILGLDYALCAVSRSCPCL